MKQIYYSRRPNNRKPFFTERDFVTKKESGVIFRCCGDQHSGDWRFDTL